MTEIDPLLPVAPPGRPTPSRDAETLSGLVAAIYDAALDPRIWATVLKAATVYLGGYTSSIYAKSISGMAAGVYHDDGVLSDHQKLLYFERYAWLDPATASHIYAKIEQPISTVDILNPAELYESRFFKEWAEPQGLVDFLSAPIEKQGQWAALFGVFRHRDQGMVDEPMRQRMRLLVPHVRRAVLIGKVIETGTQQAASLTETLDGLAAGLFLVDGRGQVVHANAAAENLLGDAIAVTTRDGHLAPTDRAAAAALSEALLAAAGGDAGLGLRGISVPIEGRDGAHYVAHVLPLTSGARRSAGAQYAATAAVFVHRAVLHTPAAPELIAKTFGLTLSELRVMLTIAQVGGVAETAATLGIGEATVKKHLHRVFAKTGTARQADLVRLMAGFAGPLTG